MNKSINDLLTPSWMKAIKQLDKQTNALSLALEESSILKSIREFSEPEFSSFILHESSTEKILKELNNYTGLETLALHESSIMRHFKEITESTLLNSLALQESSAMQAMRQFSDLSSFNALKTLTNSPFNNQITSFVSEAHLQPDTPTIISQSLINADNEIANELSSCSDFELLSDNTKKVLLYIYHYYFLPIFLSCCAVIIMENTDIARTMFSEATTATEVRSLVRSPSIRSFDRTLLKDFRVTTGHDVNFREEPKMKSNIITKLPIGSLVEVIDKSNRSWLFVEIKINGEFKQGWISRKYTTYFK